MKATLFLKTTKIESKNHQSFKANTRKLLLVCIL